MLPRRLRPRQRRQQLGSSRSASVNSEGSTFAPEAVALSFTCSGRDAPTIAEVTFGCLRTHASANWARVRFALPASCLTFCTASRVAGVNQAGSRNAPIEGSAARLFAGTGEFGKYFPVRTPCASGDQTNWVIPDFPDRDSNQFYGRACNSEELRLL